MKIYRGAEVPCLEAIPKDEDSEEEECDNDNDHTERNQQPSCGNEVREKE